MIKLILESLLKFIDMRKDGGKLKKVLWILSLILCTSLFGCGTAQSTSAGNQNQTAAAPKQITINSGADSSSGGNTNAKLDKEAFKNGYTTLTLKDSAVYTSLFQVNGTTTVFPNWDDNNKLSIIKEPYPKGVVNTSNVSDFFDYPVNSVAVINNIAYFSDADNKNSLGSVDLSNRAYNSSLALGKVSNMIAVNNVIYFIDAENGNKLYAFDTANNTEAVICSDNVGNYLVDEDTILYENKSDNSTLYSVNVDGSQRQKLSNFSVNSFAPYSGQILAINSSDNNNLYAINLTDLSVKRLAVMNGEDLKIFNGTIYFIDASNNRHLSKMTVDLTTPKVSFNDISDYGVNEYYPTSKGIFARKSVSVDNGYIYLPA